MQFLQVFKVGGPDPGASQKTAKIAIYLGKLDLALKNGPPKGGPRGGPRGVRGGVPGGVPGVSNGPEPGGPHWGS